MILEITHAVKLRLLLNDPRWRFRKLATLAAAIGADVEQTRDTLREMGGARPARGNAELWGLVSRVGVREWQAILLAHLGNPDHYFRKLATLAAAIGATETDTLAMLATLPARPARGNRRLWGLTSRVGQ